MSAWRPGDPEKPGIDLLGVAPEVLAAINEGMLRLAAERTDGAHPFFVPVDHTAWARAVICRADAAVVVGDKRTLTELEPKLRRIAGDRRFEDLCHAIIGARLNRIEYAVQTAVSPIAAHGATALAESYEKEGSWRWRAFSFTCAIGILFGLIYIVVGVVGAFIGMGTSSKRTTVWLQKRVP